VTDNPSETVPDEAVADDEAPATDEGLGADLAARLGATSWTDEHATVRIHVERDRWAESIGTALDTLPFFSWLSAVDWSREVAVGEPAEDVDSLEERFDVLVRLSSVESADAAIIATSLPKDDAWIDSLVGVAGGAAWHEREASEMFGIDFRGNPNLAHLYLPDAFEGHPLLKSFPLLTREVKPWPGTVDVEDMPSVDNTEADAIEDEQA
jgi:NADH-quinone oxidoreductase subunit C